MAELQRGGIEGEAVEVSPEIELVTGSATTEALKEIAADVNREAPWVGGGSAVAAERAGTAPLRAALDQRLIGEKLQHAADGDSAADGWVVELAHEGRLLVLLWLVRRPLPAAFCSARWAR